MRFGSLKAGNGQADSEEFSFLEYSFQRIYRQELSGISQGCSENQTKPVKNSLWVAHKDVLTGGALSGQMVLHLARLSFPYSSTDLGRGTSPDLEPMQRFWEQKFKDKEP